MMLNSPGYSIITEPGKRDIEHDVFTCGHCQSITFTKSGHGRMQVLIMKNDGTQEMRECGFCRNCYRYICPRCEGMPCYPAEKRIEEEEKLARRFICT